MAANERASEEWNRPLLRTYIIQLITLGCVLQWFVLLNFQLIKQLATDLFMPPRCRSNFTAHRYKSNRPKYLLCATIKNAAAAAVRFLSWFIGQRKYLQSINEVRRLHRLAIWWLSLLLSVRSVDKRMRGWLALDRMTMIIILDCFR